VAILHTWRSVQSRKRAAPSQLLTLPKLKRALREFFRAIRIFPTRRSEQTTLQEPLSEDHEHQQRPSPKSELWCSEKDQQLSIDADSLPIFALLLADKEHGAWTKPDFSTVTAGLLIPGDLSDHELELELEHARQAWASGQDSSAGPKWSAAVEEEQGAKHGEEDKNKKGDATAEKNKAEQEKLLETQDNETDSAEHEDDEDEDRRKGNEESDVVLNGPAKSSRKQAVVAATRLRWVCAVNSWLSYLLRWHHNPFAFLLAFK
jgi:hypothetical protein